MFPYGKINIAKQTCPQNRFLKCYAVLRRRRSKASPEQAGISATRALSRFSADEFLDELFGREFLLWKKVRPCLDFADFQFFLFSPAGEKSVVTDLGKTGR